jgi:hypothetical protein
LSETLMLAENEVALVGLKVTEMLQDAPAARVVPHGLVVLVTSANTPGFVPVSVTPLMVNAAFPEFVTWTTLTGLVVPTVWLAKATLVGRNVTAGAGAGVPVPLSVRVKTWFAPPPLLEAWNVATTPL